MGISYNDIQNLEEGINYTLEVYDSIRCILLNLYQAKCMLPRDALTLEDWDEMGGTITGVLELFRSAEHMATEKIDPAVKRLYDIYQAQTKENKEKAAGK